MREIKIKQAINDLINENKLLQDKISKQEYTIKRLKANEQFFCRCVTKAIKYINNNTIVTISQGKEILDVTQSFKPQELLDIIQGYTKED